MSARPVSTPWPSAWSNVGPRLGGIALSSNLHPAGFDELMPKTVANAAVERLMHHAHIVITTGDSIRLTQATRGKGVRPLAN